MHMTNVESKRGKTALQIQFALHHVFEGDAPSHSTVKRWIADFKSGRRTSFDDAERSGQFQLQGTRMPMLS